jgi:prepilin-type processing-associated H-X9-DG protein
LKCIRNGSLFPYLGDVGDEKVYVCPTMQRVARDEYSSGSEFREVARSYGMNASLEDKDLADRGWTRRYYDINGASRTLMFAEQGFVLQSGYNYAFRNTGTAWTEGDLPQLGDPPGNYTRRYARNHDACIDWRGSVTHNPDAGGDQTYEHIGEYHDGRGNCVFCDGHIERIEYDETRFICQGDWEAGRRIE